MSRFSSLYSTIIKGSLLAGVSGFLLNSSLYTVTPGHRGIIFDRIYGVKEQSSDEGMHFLVPWFQHVNQMDVRIKPHEVSTNTGTKDLQNVNLTLRILYHPNLDHVPLIYKQLGLDFAQRVLPSLSNEVLKSVVAQYNADQLLTLRDQVSKDIRDALTERCGSFNILVDDVALTMLNFSSDFTKAIEDKQVAEQLAERAKFVVAKAEQEKRAVIIRAEGDATAARLISDSVIKSGRGLIELRRIETAVSVADSLSQSKNVTYLPSGNSMILQLPQQH